MTAGTAAAIHTNRSQNGIDGGGRRGGGAAGVGVGGGASRAPVVGGGERVTPASFEAGGLVTRRYCLRQRLGVVRCRRGRDVHSGWRGVGAQPSTARPGGLASVEGLKKGGATIKEHKDHTDNATAEEDSQHAHPHRKLRPRIAPRTPLMTQHEATQKPVAAAYDVPPTHH